MTQDTTEEGDMMTHETRTIQAGPGQFLTLTLDGQVAHMRATDGGVLVARHELFYVHARGALLDALAHWDGFTEQVCRARGWATDYTPMHGPHLESADEKRERCVREIGCVDAVFNTMGEADPGDPHGSHAWMMGHYFPARRGIQWARLDRDWGISDVIETMAEHEWDYDTMALAENWRRRRYGTRPEYTGSCGRWNNDAWM
jgi:hypothetical protein